MKIIISILLITCSVFSFAQNYDCLQFGPKNYFINGNGYVRGIRIDSTHTSGSDVVYYPYRTGRINNYVPGGPVTTTTGASWLGKNVIKHADGTFLFDNYWDTVIIKSHANVGDSWIFYDDTSHFYYTASVTAEDTMTVLGVVDSVKKMTITADTGGSIYSIDPVNNFQIILSKNNGFVQIFDLYTFPYHRPDTISFHLPTNYFIRYFDYYLDGLLSNQSSGDLGPIDNKPDTINSVFHLFAFHNPTTMEIYNFNVGDVYESVFRATYPAPADYVEYHLDSIMSKTASPYSVSYGGTTHSLSIFTDYSYTPPKVTNTFAGGAYSAGGGGDTSLLINFMPEELGSPSLLHYFPNPLPYHEYTICDSPASYEIDVDYHGSGFVYNGIGYDPSTSYSVYSMGYGISYQTSPSGYFYMPNQTTFCGYYHKDSSSCGGFLNLVPSAVSSVSLNNFIRILPNPASNYMSITCDAQFGPNTLITVYDVSGRSVFCSHAENRNEIIISTSSMADGLYMVIVQDNTGIVKREKVIVAH